MEERLKNDVSAYLIDTPETSEIIALSIRLKTCSFRKKRNYPSGYTEEKIKRDMEECYACIFDLVMYFLSKQGVEFQTSHSESSVVRNWVSEDEIYIYHGVFPFAGSLK